jgi:DNA-binding XRE family transcriptional regulator
VGLADLDKLHIDFADRDAGHGMKRAMRRLREQILRDETEMRAFYESVGISQSTIDAAIEVRRNSRPAIEQDNELAVRDKPRE